MRPSLSFALTFFTIVALATPDLIRRADAPCKTFSPAGKYGRDGYSSVSSRSFRVSQGLNCTAELARSDGGYSTNSCEYHRYAMGLIVSPTLNVSASDGDKAAIYDLVLATTGLGYYVDFNGTIVMNYTCPYVGFNVNFTGYYDFTPYTRCFDGVLSDCTGSIANNTLVTACGYQYLNSQQKSLPPERQQYDGVNGMVTTDGSQLDGLSIEPQPRYDDVKGNATVFQKGKSAAGLGRGNVATGMLTALGLAWTVWWSLT